MISGLAALIGGLCCLTPIVLALLGLASVAVAADLGNVLYGNYRWVFRIVALGFVAAALVIYFRRRGICTLDQARQERNRILNTSLVVSISSMGAYILWTYVAVHYWGIAVGLPWAQYDESWAIPLAAAVLAAAVLLHYVLLRGPRKVHQGIVERALAERGRLRTLGLGAGLLLVAIAPWAIHYYPVIRSKSVRGATHIQLESQAHSEDPGGPYRSTNHLINEKSPYLLMHAHNPVEWYPWGEQALEKARREQKPIFLSIGYYTCHWCHVMERESFADPSIAEIMNRHFVSIKVDREERPDLDRVYMNFVEATTGSGGWPMSVFLTPDRKPFFGGTYFPKEDSYGRPGFRSVLQRVADAWQKNRGRILQSADQITQKLQEMLTPQAGAASQLHQAVLDKTYEQIRASYDRKNGGFGGAPKFPRPVVLNFLFRYYARTDQEPALEMALATLRAMDRGGIHDHIGGGFHRYSTNALWHVPHFEKMLYDQAQLAISYTDAYQITRDQAFAHTARDILDSVLRDMRGQKGGFYSALDADSLREAGKPEHGEGAFYVWEAKQIEQVLGPEKAAIFDFYYGVTPGGNVPPEQDFQGEFKNRNILFVQHTLAATAQKFGKSGAEIRSQLEAARKELFAARAKRPRPPLDDKVLTTWNGLMISALARAAQVLEEPRYLEPATSAAGFIQAKLYDPKRGILQRRYRGGEAAVDGFLDDYAFFIQGLLDLYETSFDMRWLMWAVQLQEAQDRLFWDGKSGGYLTTQGTDPSILMQTREDYDGAEPSPNSVAAMNLLRLAQITDRQAWARKAEKTFGAFAQRLQARPEALPQMAAALDFSLSKPKQVIIAGAQNAPDTRVLLRLVHERYIPNKIVLLADGAEGQKQLAQWLPFIQGVTRKQGRATAYICESYVCKLPSADPQVVARLLKAKS